MDRPRPSNGAEKRVSGSAHSSPERLPRKESAKDPPIYDPSEGALYTHPEPPTHPVGVLQRPYGLSKEISMTEYEADPVCVLSSFNYKVEAFIGPSYTTTQRMLTVFDTGAGPNLIRADMVPQGTRMFKRKIVNLASASKHRLETLGIVSLTVDLSGYVCKQPFVVTRNLAADAILGTTFTDRHCDKLSFRNRQVTLSDGTVVPIVRRLAGVPSRERQTESPTIQPRPAKDELIRSAERVVLPPTSETNIKVVCGQTGLMLFEAKPDLYLRRRVTLTNGVGYCVKNMAFPLRIANFSSTEKVISKNQVLGRVAPAPDTLYPVKEVPRHTDRNPTDTGNAVMACEEEYSSPQTDLQATPTDVEVAVLNPSRIKDGVPIRELLEAPAEEPEQVGRLPTVEDINLSHLDKRIQRRFRRVLSKFRKMWSGDIGEVKRFKHHISLQPDAKPIRCQPHRAGPQARAEIKKQVTAMKEAGVIQDSQSEWASPVVLAPKKDGSLRFCVDYRRLNSLTIRDSYPLPRMEDCIDSLGDAKYFTTLDCNAGYWQIPVAPGDRGKTAFVCHEGCFEYCRMPFGLTNAPATFQRAIDMVLGQYRWKTCLVYLDDIIVFSQTAEEHIRHVEEVLTTLQDAGFSLKLRKCEFFAETVDYLGHVIRPGRLQVAQQKIEAVKGFKMPTTQTELRSFLGLCNVYRRFVPNFARAAAPLNDLLKKGQAFELPPLDEKQRKAFDSLKQALIEPPILRLPQSDLEYSVDTDACNHQVGCALLQTHEDGTRHPIGFWSRSLTPAEKKYSVGEKECLAIVWALQILRLYLERKHFRLYTDHQALKWILSGSDAGSGRLARWRLRLLEFDFTIEYKKGAKNTIADAISRLPTFGETQVAPDVDIPCYFITEVEKKMTFPVGFSTPLERSTLSHRAQGRKWGKIKATRSACA